MGSRKEKKVQGRIRRGEGGRIERKLTERRETKGRREGGRE